MLTQVRQGPWSKIQERFGELFTDPRLQAPPRPDPRRERPDSIRRTVWCFLGPILHENTSCRQVVRQWQAVLARPGILNLDPDHSADCQARARVPRPLLEQGLRQSAQAAEQQAPERRLLQGRVLQAADGSTVRLADTPANQKQYPQQQGQKPGCGFPMMRLSVVFSLQSGAVLDVATGNYYQHELRLFHGLQDHWQPDPIVVDDRAGGHFGLAAT
jgi:hypothetical protein